MLSRSGKARFRCGDRVRILWRDKVREWTRARPIALKPLMKWWLRYSCETVGCCCVIAPQSPLVSERLGPPGGHVEAGETPRDALARELEEELSILIGEPGPEVASVVEAGLAMRIWLVEQWTGHPVNVSPAEHDDLGWFSASEAEELRLAHSSYSSLIRDTLSRNGLPRRL